MCVLWFSMDVREVKEKEDFVFLGFVVERRKRKDLEWVWGYLSSSVCYKNNRYVK